MPHEENRLYLPYFGILSIKNTPRDSRDTKADTNRVHGHPWSVNGPDTAPEMDLTIFEKMLWFLRKFRVFLYFVFSSPSNHVGTLIWSLSNCTKAQGTLLDLHGPPNGPQNGPSEAYFWGPLIKKDPAGFHHGPNWSICLDSFLDNEQSRVYSQRFSDRGRWLRPSPVLISFKFHSRLPFPQLGGNCPCVSWKELTFGL